MVSSTTLRADTRLCLHLLGSPQHPAGSGHTYVEMSTSKQSLPSQRVEALMSLNENSGHLDWVQFRGPWGLSCTLWSEDLRPPRCWLWLAGLPMSPSWTCIIRAARVLLPDAALLSGHNSKVTFKLCPTSALMQKILYHQECLLVLISPIKPSKPSWTTP